ncbi:MAG: hypothetical protein DHS80DRAFT_731, partial [Piptocephalis tieghemiana]
PTWHTISWHMERVLSSHHQKPIPSKQIIKEALALDAQISKLHSLPRAFRGKTPEASASAVLSTNKDRLFIPSRKGRKIYYQLAWKPRDIPSAVAAYNSWMTDLVSHDWPLCFGVPKEHAKRADAVIPTSGFNEVNLPTRTKSPSFESTEPIPAQLVPSPSQQPARNKEKSISPSPLTKPEAQSTTPSPSASSLEETLEVYGTPLPLDQLDLRLVPKGWEDIVRVGISTIPGAGRGLFAVRNLPAWTVLGFYFGVPDFEDDFDRDKDGVGIASSYSIRYRHTVLDATDALGQPFDQPGISPVYCPWHFMNEDTNRGNVLFVEGARVNMVICMSTRRIGAGEELFVYYGTDVERDEWQAHPLDSEKHKLDKAKEDVPMEEGG